MNDLIKFKTILIDPPWPYEKPWKGPPGSNCITPIPYPLMSLSDIRSLPIRELSDIDCELYLWTTQRFLPYAIQLLRQWDFDYRTTITWCKELRGKGQGGVWTPTTEFLIHGRRGRMPFPYEAGKSFYRNKSTWVNCSPEIRRHSQKPLIFHHLIEAVSDAPRLEMFARNKPRNSWIYHGNEIEYSFSLQPYYKLKQMNNDEQKEKEAKVVSVDGIETKSTGLAPRQTTPQMLIGTERGKITISQNRIKRLQEEISNARKEIRTATNRIRHIEKLYNLRYE